MKDIKTSFLNFLSKINYKFLNLQNSTKNNIIQVKFRINCGLSFNG